MSKALFILFVFNMQGEVVYKIPNLTLEHCVARWTLERESLGHVQKLHPEINLQFKCVEQTNG